MKPNKSRVFCPSARKQKIKFDSEEAAKRFINWNGKEILEENGYAPRRAYYCPACGGWHVTSSLRETNNVVIERELSNKVLPASLFKCKPNDNVLVPLYSKIVKLAIRSLNLGFNGSKRKALRRCNESIFLVEKTEELGKILGVKSKQLYRCTLFKSILKNIQEALNESPINNVRLDELMNQVYWFIEKNGRNNFSYTPYNTGGFDYKVTPYNIESVLYNLREKEKEEQLSKEINMLIPAAEMCINYGKYNQAKSNISDSISKAMKLSVPEKRIQYVFRCLELIIKKNWVPKEELEELFKGTEYESSLEELIEKYT